MNRKKKSELTDHLSFKETKHQVKAVFEDYLHLLREWVIDYGRIFLPGILLISIFATALIAFSARQRVIAAELAAEESLADIKEVVKEVENVPFEVNAYPELEKLMRNYYLALADADLDALVSIQSTVTNPEIIRLGAMASYIEKYDNLVVYTKPGPYEDTFIAYVYTDIYLIGQEHSTPGLQAFYICKDPEKGYYLNTGELSEEEAEYIRQIAKQDDVVDLKNTVNVQYTSLLEEDSELNDQMAEISVEIDMEVGEQLAEEAVNEQRLQEELNGGEDTPEFEPEEEEPQIIKVKTNSLVNVRKSASATADKLGSASLGSVFIAMEILPNGWTKIDYDGKEGFIKSEYLDVIESSENFETKGKIIATTILNVRADASASAAKIGVLNENQVAELIEEVGEWCKIKFNDEVGYVKTEYVIIQ